MVEPGFQGRRGKRNLRRLQPHETPILPICIDQVFSTLKLSHAGLEATASRYLAKFTNVQAEIFINLSGGITIQYT